MAKAKKQEPKLALEREYTVPLRQGWLKVPKSKRANKAVKTLKGFIARHMKVYDKDLRKIKIDMLLNNELRFKGMRKPPARIKVRAKKYDDDIVKVELVEIPAHIKFAKLREEKKTAEIKKKVEEKEEAKKAAGVEKEKEPEESKEDKEKEQAAREESLKLAKQQARTEKHTSKEKPAEKQWIEKQRKTVSRPGVS